MKWPNVKLIFTREMRDQLRDRRTLFTVAVMPLILYPLMGMAMLQVAQFMREYPTKVWIVGVDNLPAETPLVENGEIYKKLASDKDRRLITIAEESESDGEFQEIFKKFRNKTEKTEGSQLFDRLIQKEMQRRKLDVAVFIPSPIVSTSIPNSTPEDAKDSDENSTPKSVVSIPEVYIFQNTASDKSRIGAERIGSVFSSWRNSFVKKSLSDLGIPISVAQGFRMQRADVADKAGKQAAAWSKILPFIVMIWCLTGAFYPAIDLVAGEKERGTFETLLSSPAGRSEIAIGKLLTVMTFSIVTSILNLLSMGVTGLFVVSRLGSGAEVAGGFPIGAPPIASIFWLMLALIPISALFSAVALAAAAFARSSKEGQYYLVPLMMISMPLMMVPMLPGAQLDFGTSLIPVSGLMLLLRGLIEGQYSECLRFAGPVCAITLVCCWLSVRWVVHQFNSETVLFRASERFGVGPWVRQLMRERNELPSFGNAILCAIVILVAQFFLQMVVQAPTSFLMFSKITLIMLLSSIAAPAIMMAVVLTRNPLKSLRLRSCTLPMAFAAVAAAVLLNPLFMWFSAFIMYLYPPAGDLLAMESAVSSILGDSPGIWATILVIALAPAVIEELAYRGFILSGFEAMKNKWQAIFLSSLFFGMAHGVIQQSIITFGVGLILGVIAVQTRSIIPCILFHLTHNSMAVLLSNAKSTIVEGSPLLSRLLVSSDGASYTYAMLPATAMTLSGVLILIWFCANERRPSQSEDKISAWTTWLSRFSKPKSA